METAAKPECNTTYHWLGVFMKSIQSASEVLFGTTVPAGRYAVASPERRSEMRISGRARVQKAIRRPP
jgi:hypothetical protein